MDGIEVNRDPDLDPLFGEVQPQDPDVLWVTVTPKRSQERVLGDYFFIMILPTMDEEEKSDVIHEVMQLALKAGDTYSVKSVTEDMAEAFELSTPIMSFNQKELVNSGEVQMLWLRPPKDLMQ